MACDSLVMTQFSKPIQCCRFALRRSRGWPFPMMSPLSPTSKSLTPQATTRWSIFIEEPQVFQANDLCTFCGMNRSSNGEEADVFADAGLRGRDHTQGSPGYLGSMARRDAPRQATSAGHGKRDGCVGGPNRASQGQHAGEGRTPISGHQAPVRSHQGALQGTGEEHGAVAHPVCVEQSVDGAASALERGTGMSAPEMGDVAKSHRQNGPNVPQRSRI